MTTTAKHNRQYAILDSDRQIYAPFLGSHVSVCSSARKIAQCYDESPQGLTWIAWSRRFTDELLKIVSHRRAQQSGLGSSREDSVLTVSAPRLESIPVLHGLFAHVVGDSPAYRWLPKDELVEVLLNPDLHQSEVFIGAAADEVTSSLSLVRGDLRQFVVPFSLFESSGDGTKPDFSRLRVTDFGRTIALGDYEAAADAILYETDREYRKKISRSRKENERTFGASLFRLRLQRRLKRKDFAPLAAKTIARIERNEIAKPHGATLEAIAERLGVPPDEIGEY
jgi:hypothetical protein